MTFEWLPGGGFLVDGWEVPFPGRLKDPWSLARMEIDSVLRAAAAPWRALSPNGSPRIERTNVTSVRQLPLAPTQAGSTVTT